MASELEPVNGRLDTENGVYFSATAIAGMAIPGYPKTRAGIYKRAAVEAWPVIYVQGRGARDGVKYFKMPEHIAPDSIKRLTKPLITGTGERSNLHTDQDALHYVELDYYPNVKGSAGPGSSNDGVEDVVIPVRFDAQLLREIVGNDFRCIKIGSVSGESMYPTLKHGDQVLINTAVSQFIDDAIYALIQDGFMRFKRIQKRLDGSILVKSDNPKFGEAEIYKQEVAETFHIAGIVIPFKFGRFTI